MRNEKCGKWDYRMRNYRMEVPDAELVHGETEAHIDGWCRTAKKGGGSMYGGAA